MPTCYMCFDAINKSQCTTFPVSITLTCIKLLINLRQCHLEAKGSTKLIRISQLRHLLLKRIEEGQRIREGEKRMSRYLNIMAQNFQIKGYILHTMSTSNKDTTKPVA